MSKLEKLQILFKTAREELGFKSKRKFFFESGGEKYFGCSDRAYSMIESGEIFPNPELFVRLLIKLKVVDVEKFYKAYFLAKLESPETINFVNMKKIEESEDRAAHHKAVASVYYNEEQLKFLSSSRDINWIYNLFIFNQKKKINLHNLVRFTGFDKGLLETYLQRLEELSLIVKKKENYACSSTLYVFPRLEEYQKYVKKIVEYNADFSPAVPFDKNSQVFQISPDKLFILQDALKKINILIRNLIRSSRGEKYRTYFYHSAIFKREDLEMK